MLPLLALALLALLLSSSPAQRRNRRIRRYAMVRVRVLTLPIRWFHSHQSARLTKWLCV